MLYWFHTLIYILSNGFIAGVTGLYSQ